MCGITGIIQLDYDSNYPICQNHLESMNKALLHRGPDHQKIYIDHKEGIGLAISRLALLDIQEGNQPMHTPDKLITLIYNGEIYDYKPWIDKLKKQGTYFKSYTDTEALLYLYQDQGITCLKYLNGEFAFAIYDKRIKTTFIVRDRIGAKPLYYTVQKGHLFFASEIKALLCHPYIQASLNPLTIYQQMMRADSLKRTFIKEIQVLPPGTYLSIQKGKVKKTTYWKPTFLPVLIDNVQEDMISAASTTKKLLEKAVKKRMVADFKVGAFLSGGLDSSIVCAMMQQTATQPIHTFSLRFKEAHYDESAYSRQVARHLGTQHHEVVIDNLHLAKNFPQAIFHAEHLVQSTDGVGKYLLAKYASRVVKAVITGEGADEIFLGYPWFKTIKTQQDWDKTRAYYCTKLIKKRETASKGLDLTLSNHNHQIASIMRYGYYPISMGNIQEMEKITTNTFSKDFLASLPIRDARQVHAENTRLEEVIGLSPIDQNRLEFIKTTLPHYVLQYLGEKMEMAHSLEGRLPFFDLELMNYAFSLPNYYHLWGMREKNLLKLAFQNTLPKPILLRTKHGYSTPILAPFLSRKRPAFFDHFLSKEIVQKHNIFYYPDIEQTLTALYDKKLTGQPKVLAEKKIMLVLSTHLLYDMFIEKRATDLPTYT